MTKINVAVLEIANKAYLKILVDNQQMVIKHKFCLGDKSILGALIFLFGGFFLMVAPFFKTSDILSKVIGVSIGLLFVMLSTMTIVRQLIDGIQITEKYLIFRYNLKETIIPLNGNLEVKMKIEVNNISRVGTLGSDFITITHFIQVQNIATPIVQFQMPNSEAENAKKLGLEINKMINAKFNHQITKTDRKGNI